MNAWHRTIVGVCLYGASGMALAQQPVPDQDRTQIRDPAAEPGVTQTSDRDQTQLRDPFLDQDIDRIRLQDPLIRQDAPTLFLSAVLSGAQQVPAVQTPGVGVIEMRFEPGMTYVEYAVAVNDLGAVSGVTLHCGPAGAQAPSVATLSAASPGEPINGIVAQGTLTSDALTPPDGSALLPDGGPACPVPLTNVAALAQAALQGLIYASVQTTEHPDGAVRGQIFPALGLRTQLGIGAAQDAQAPVPAGDEGGVPADSGADETGGDDDAGLNVGGADNGG